MVHGIFIKRKMGKEQGLAMTSGISGFLGVTEPAMFGVNLPLKYPFIASIITSGILGAFIGANRVLGNVGVGGVPAIISIQKEYWLVYGICIIIAICVPFILTVFYQDLVKKKRKNLSMNRA